MCFYAFHVNLPICYIILYCIIYFDNSCVCEENPWPNGGAIENNM